jgi:hypothetical protein
MHLSILGNSTKGILTGVNLRLTLTFGGFALLMSLVLLMGSEGVDGSKLSFMARRKEEPIMIFSFVGFGFAMLSLAVLTGPGAGAGGCVALLSLVLLMGAGGLADSKLSFMARRKDDMVD